MTDPGPITAALHSEVEHRLRERGIVVWLDRDGHYTDVVDALAERHEHGDFFAPVVPFRGSYLEMLRQLAPYGNGLDPEPLLIHMPGHTEESIRQTPVLEMYLAGSRFRKALPTLIREAASGRVRPDDLEELLGRDDLSLAAAEAWLARATVAEPGLAAWLDSFTPEWILEGLIAGGEQLAEHVSEPEQLATLLEHLYRHTGLDDAFLGFFLGAPPYELGGVRDAFAGWLMCVEYVHDLTRPPHLEALRPLAALSPPLRKTCGRLVAHLRDRHPDAYAALADATEAQLEAELPAMRPEELGKIDTFRGEEVRVLEGAVGALAAGEWDKALQWAAARLDGEPGGKHGPPGGDRGGGRSPSFWLPRDRGRRMAWRLAAAAAELGSALARHERPLTGAGDLAEALERYTASAFEVDRGHRRFEQLRWKLLQSTLPHFGELHEIADKLRRLYRDWADRLAGDFAALCDREGFLPEPGLQQRTLYDQVVHPLTQGGGQVAYFLIDAFRYEMATELLEELEGSDVPLRGTANGGGAHLAGRYAELPTLTAVGMNCLAPVARAGKLTLASGKGFGGFKTGEFTVRDRKSRVRAMGVASVDAGGAARQKTRLLKLAEVCERPIESLKLDCQGAGLVVVHSREIDDAGEANVGVATFESWIAQLKTAWHHLRQVGITDFVFTADHGFLLLDRTTTQPKRSFGTRRDPGRRHVLAAEARREPKLSVVSLAALGYEGQGGSLHFQRNTAVFATGNPGATFVHGGNTLQERVIPVLTVSHRRPARRTTARYRIAAEPLPALAGLQRLRLALAPERDAQSELSFVATVRVGLALRVPQRDDVRVDLKDAVGAALHNQQVQLEVGGSAEVAFELLGGADERVRVEVYHPEGTCEIEPRTPETFFDVAGTTARPEPAAGEEPAAALEAPPGPTAASWHAGFDDPKVLAVFRHIETHGAVTEEELNRMLPSPRSVRRFSLKLEDYAQRVPFAVRIEVQPSGKRYVKDR